MTNYRIQTHLSEMQEFKFCFSCGKPMIHKEFKNWLECSENSLHLKIWFELDEEENTQFI